MGFLRIDSPDSWQYTLICKFRRRFAILMISIGTLFIYSAIVIALQPASQAFTQQFTIVPVSASDSE